METDGSAAPRPADPAREWFWTGVPAGFIFSIVGLVLWVFLGFWLSALVVVVIVAGSARFARRDGRECVARYLIGVAVLLVPAVILYTVFIRAVLGG